RGSGRIAAELLPPPQPPPQRRGHVVWCVGRGGGGGGSKAERGDGRETPHTHGTRWPERQQHPELSGVPTRPRGPPAGVEVRPGGPQARGGEAAAAETRSALCRGRISRQMRPERPGPRRRKRRCGIVRRGSPMPRRLDPARARGPARESCAGDLQVPAAALRPGNLQD
ncbi:RNA-binding motif protein, X-linked-like-2, partial [Pteronotus mesoamericanus]|uniref:RNA-binding motif protein, X-linked-like-2 n=1 Tax=Pteronotus mesoamericanus TaxID=1884717 RepID=UPI0023EDE1A0